MNKTILGALGLLSLLLLATTDVSAHAKLIKANPAPGAVVARAPTQVQLWFDEQVEPSFSQVQVLDRARTRFDTDEIWLAPDDAKALIVPLKPLGAGAYSVVWKVLSATDGHITRGVFAFSVGQAAGPVVAPLETGGGVSESNPLSAVVRGLGLIALLALVGGFFFRLFLLERSPGISPHTEGNTNEAGKISASPAVGEIVYRRWMQLTTVALALAFIASAVELLLQANLIAEEISLQAVADVLFATRFGSLWFLRGLILVVIATLLYARTRRARIVIPSATLAVTLALFSIANVLALTRGIFLSKLFDTQGMTGAQQIYLYVHHLGLFLPFVLFFALAFYQKYSVRGLLPILGALALLTRSLGSHGAAAEGDFSLAVAADWFHLIAVAVWVGGLCHLAFLLPVAWRALDPQARGKWLAWLVPQFSIAALAATLVIALTGLYSSFLEIPALDALVKGLYGETLVTKVALFGVMLALGAVNLLFISPRLRRQGAAPEQSVRGFRVTVGAEVALGLAAIYLAGLLTLETPARSEATPLAPAVAATPASARVAFKGDAAPEARVSLVIAPDAQAPTEFDALVTDAQGQPTADILRVIFNFTLLDSDTGAQNVIAEPRAAGHYVANGSYLPLDGMWRLRVTVRRKGVEDASVEFPFYVAGAARAVDDPKARALLIASERRMNTLTALRARQDLNDGANNAIVTEYEYRAPDRLRFNVLGQASSIAIGHVQYYQDAAGQWSVRARVEPFIFPNFNLAAQAQAVRLGRTENVGNEPAQIIVFAAPNSSGSGLIHYAQWLATRDQRLLQFAMATDSHYMLEAFRDFDAGDIAIDAPANAVAPTLPAASSSAKPAPTTATRARGLITGDLEGDGALVLFVLGVVVALVGSGRNRARNTRLAALALGLAGAGAGLALFADAVNATASNAATAPVSVVNAARGETSYREHCVTCHGVGGKGDGPASASLPVKPFDLTTHVLLHDEQYLHAVILNGRGYMPAFGDRLTQDLIFDVIAYIRQLALKAQTQTPRRGFTPQAP